METHPSPSISLKNQFPNIPKFQSKMLDPPNSSPIKSLLHYIHYAYDTLLNMPGNA